MIKSECSGDYKRLAIAWVTVPDELEVTITAALTATPTLTPTLTLTQMGAIERLKPTSQP